jgi:hypothetical protein
MAFEGLTENAIWRVVNADGGYGRDPSIPQGELARLISGAVTKAGSGFVPPSPLPTPPADEGTGERFKLSETATTPTKKIEKSEQLKLWTENAQKFATEKLGITPADLWDQSPIRFSSPLCQLTLLETLFADSEIVAVQRKHYGAEDEALPVEEWRKRLRKGKLITGRKGAWLRPNPVKRGTPSGENGTYTDADCFDVRLGFLEHDRLPLGVQLAMFASFRLPIVAITDSAGKSYHALVRLRGNTPTERRSWWNRTLDELHRLFGYDASNKNPSKYTRLAGAFRDEGRRADSDGEQRLLYLASDRPEGTTIL